MRISREARTTLGVDFASGVRASDRHAPLDGVIEAGWIHDGDATLLAAFRDSYFGDRSQFAFDGSYELAVNGRGIPDLDIGAMGQERIVLLMRRGIAFAWDALHAANTSTWKPSLTARVSAAPVLMDPDLHTGYVTFFSSRFAHELGMDEGVALHGIQILLSSDHCVNPLPG